MNHRQWLPRRFVSGFLRIHKTCKPFCRLTNCKDIHPINTGALKFHASRQSQILMVRKNASSHFSGSVFKSFNSFFFFFFLNFLEYFLHLTIVGKLVPKTWKNTSFVFFVLLFLSIALDIRLEKGSCSVFSQQMIFIRKILLNVLFLFCLFSESCRA